MNRQTARSALTDDFDHTPANSSPVLAVSFLKRVFKRFQVYLWGNASS